MSIAELIALVFENMMRRKVRVALTAIGVIIGTAAVVILVSLGIGLQENATQQLGGIGDLTQIQVSPGFNVVEGVGGGGGGGGGGSIALPVKPGQPSDTVLITDQSLKDFAAIPAVVAVIPRDWSMSGGTIQYQRLETYPNLIGIGTGSIEDLGLTVQAGETVLSKGTVIIGAQIPLSFYDPRLRPGQEPPPPPELLGQQLKMTLIKYSSDGTEIRKSIPLRVVGIITETRGESDYSIYLPIDDLKTMNEWAIGRRINRNTDGYGMAVVKVESVDRVLDVNDTITGMGYQAFTAQQYVQGINGFFVVLQVVFGGVGAIALLVAAIGIANTMAMAILERTREIGLMKAIGATNRDVLSVFLGEAAGIGFVGGIGGVAVGWAASQVLNVLAVAYFTGQAAQGGGPPPPSTAVVTPFWLPLGVLIFATFVGLVSGVYPALQAARYEPVKALKYE
jgi:putative ABC transport system permease protein